MELSNCHDFEFLIIHVDLRLKNRFSFILQETSRNVTRKRDFFEIWKKKLDVEKKNDHDFDMSDIMFDEIPLFRCFTKLRM